MVDIIPLKLNPSGEPLGQASHEVLNNDGTKLFSVRAGKPGETDTWLSNEYKQLGIYTGFWAITESDSTVNYNEWEYFHFLKGEAIITNNQGQSWTVNNNMAVIVPNGFKGRWQTTKPIVKKFVIIAPEQGLRENHDPNKLIIISNDSPDMPEMVMEKTPAEKLLSAPGTMDTTTWNFYNDENNSVIIDCGRWWCKVGKKNTFHEGYWEFCHLLRGAATLTNDAGQSWSFKAGDGFIVPPNFKGTWDTTEELLKEYVIVTPR